MSADARTAADWTAGTEDWEPWMQLIDWEMLDWISGTPASAAQIG